MRTTLNIDDALYRELKLRAAQTGRTVTELVDEAIRLALRGDSATDYRFEPETVAGKVRAGVDVADRRSLFDIMDGRE